MKRRRGRNIYPWAIVSSFTSGFDLFADISLTPISSNLDEVSRGEDDAPIIGEPIRAISNITVTVLPKLDDFQKAQEFVSDSFNPQTGIFGVILGASATIFGIVAVILTIRKRETKQPK